MNAVVFVLLFFFVQLAKAMAAAIVCPVCAVVIASGLGVSKLLGVSDCVVAVWFGAMLFALCQLCSNFIDKKNMSKPLLKWLVYILTYSSIIPLYLGASPLLVFNLKTIIGVDEFIFFTAAGSLILFLSSKFYQWMKNKNGKPHFPFEKVVLPIAALVIFSTVINYIYR
ncbi:MAG: hypothetical protein LBP39_03410 [Rickettsiales bacterium]|jgi:hypothetical protein|nr:hypothetical protein [Rickettsiales bacterium]